ncbi:hypothetical protein [Tenggerimyces flavus]|uniref:Uncharacterized protein n=1 Tax=Tenggerimyces flavus TaxID=1708749 RepID=A0ABV7Y4J8_9ACTN|nr:hypothetical protein [Tenggerimyces flavus]MBM7790318.1 hypothetical protein [Tenggerimyces flavus]
MRPRRHCGRRLRLAGVEQISDRVAAFGDHVSNSDREVGQVVRPALVEP